MPRLVPGPVTVDVPATSANLGPGFDTLGVALRLRDRLHARVTDDGVAITVTGVGADEVPRDESHLVIRSMRAAFDRMGVQPSGIELSCENTIPHGRGLGSSSAAIVGGLLLARALVAEGPAHFDDPAVLELAADLEGHPDNVAAALFGGLVISGREQDRWFAVQCEVDPRIGAVVFVPGTTLHTTVSRALLPTAVPHAAAAANAGRAALLVSALERRPEYLFAATRDYLHQEFREPAMPESLDLVHRLRAEGVPAVVSGAGPSVLAFVADEVLSVRTAQVVRRCPPGWSAHTLPLDRHGARLRS